MTATAADWGREERVLSSATSIVFVPDLQGGQEAQVVSFQDILEGAVDDEDSEEE